MCSHLSSTHGAFLPKHQAPAEAEQQWQENSQGHYINPSRLPLLCTLEDPDIKTNTWSFTMHEKRESRETRFTVQAFLQTLYLGNKPWAFSLEHSLMFSFDFTPISQARCLRKSRTTFLHSAPMGRTENVCTSWDYLNVKEFGLARPGIKYSRTFIDRFRNFTSTSEDHHSRRKSKEEHPFTEEKNPNINIPSVGSFDFGSM